jgi:hypothetical protein
MMGRLKSDQGQLFYEFHLGDADDLAAALADMSKESRTLLLIKASRQFPRPVATGAAQ